MQQTRLGRVFVSFYYVVLKNSRRANGEAALCEHKAKTKEWSELAQLGLHERIDYLFDTDLKVIQAENLFAFSLDSVLLARFVYVPIRDGRLVDLCTGNGAIPFLLSKRTKGQITGIELQPEVYDLAIRGLALNQLAARIRFICDDARRAPERLGRHQADIVTCNPPYFTKEAAKDQKLNKHLAIARHEICITLGDVVGAGSLLLKQKGKLALVHRPDRLIDIVSEMRKAGIEPKRLQFVHPKKGRPANMVLIEGTKDGRPGLSVLPPIHVYDESGKYTEDVWPK